MPNSRYDDEDAEFDALTCCWWAEWRDHPGLRTHLDKALCARWLGVIDAGLERNKGLGRRPSNWSQLARSLGRDRTTVHRWIAGETRANAIDLMTLATLIDVPLEEFLPKSQEWIELATSLLCQGYVSTDESRAYALYRLSFPQNHHPALDPAAVQQVAKAMPGWTADDVIAAIKKVAKWLKWALARQPSVERGQ